MTFGGKSLTKADLARRKLAEAEARAERLAEALRAEIPVLRLIAGFGNMSDGMTDEVADRLEAALREQENNNTQEKDCD